VGEGDGLVVHVEEAEPDLVHGVESVRDVEEDEVAVLHELMVRSLVLVKGKICSMSTVIFEKFLYMLTN
jgi:hypothetical protein